MASAQVLSNSAVSSRKQEHLEAGKRRLEEFRKKKAAAKKAAANSQLRNVDSISNENQALENGQEEFASSVGASAHERTDTVNEGPRFLDHNDKLRGSTHDSGSESVSLEHLNPQSHGFISHDSLQTQPKEEVNIHGIPGLKYQTGFIYPQEKEDRVGNFGNDAGKGIYADGILSGRSNASRDDNRSSFHHTFDGLEESVSNEDISSSGSLLSTNFSIGSVAAKVHPEGQVTNLLHSDPGPLHRPAANMSLLASETGHSQHGELLFENHLTPGFEGKNPSNAVFNLSSFGSQQESDALQAGFKSDVSGSFNSLQYSAVSETYPRRSRRSFLDSLNIVRDSSGPAQPFSQKEKFTSSKIPGSYFASSYAFQDPSTAAEPVESLQPSASPNPSADLFGNAYRGQKLFEDSTESKLEFNSQRQNEDFSALEQHIEDLTQEKFSLQRSLEASKSLAESLAAENSSLTESYNQQASIVNQLKAEMERLQGEIKDRLVELESMKAEYTNAKLECDAADERAKLLASEVIGLEEKALGLRSNELKLEWELENSNSEIASYKRKLSSLDKERQDLLQTIDALQEEKKLLQSKLRRASASGISTDIYKGHAKQDASTSTNDLGPDATGVDGNYTEQASSSMGEHDDTENLLSLLQSSHVGFQDSSMVLPPDQVQVIQNINLLISELMAEKKELMQALATEVSTSTKLKDFNKELSQKLEVQTQRLELLTAQSMANENIPARQPTSSHIVRESGAYADEGDEVVERVLGWIMNLFPGGPSKRRTSRL